MLCNTHLLLHTVLKADQPKATHIQGLLATSTEHELFLVWGQGCVPGAKTSQAKNYQTLKCKERNSWIDDSVTETQVCNNVRIERWKMHLLFLNSHHALSHHTNSYFHCSDRLCRSWLSQQWAMCQAASPPPVPSSHKQTTRNSFSGETRAGQPCRLHLCLSRSVTSSHTQGFLHQQSLLQPGSQVLFLLLCATFTLLWRTCLALGLNTS